jgi:hypothetical protein
VYDERVTDDLVERIHACLADALERTRTDPFGSPVTVAEIYQDLVPYRNVRTDLGFAMNADYEHTLLRLLAGEAELVRLDPSEAREELRQELESPNPNVGLFRKFAACDVWVAARTRTAPAEALREVPADAVPEAPADAVTEAPAPSESDDAWGPSVAEWLEDLRPGADAGPQAGNASGSPEDSPPEAGWTDEGAETELILDEAMAVLDEPTAGPAATAAPAASPVSEGSESMGAVVPQAHESEMPSGSSTCAFCAAGLPAHRPVRFCPFCGADQATVPCVACAEPIEPGWKFCVACGSAAPDMATA